MRCAMFLGLLVTASWLAGPAQAAKDYYKWTDENGVTHYSARKPYNRDAEVVSVATGQSTPVQAAPSEGEDSTAGTGNAGTDGSSGSPSPGQSQEQTLKDPERCKAARSNLEVLRTNAKVRMQSENGEIHHLSEEEKEKKVQEFQQAVEESC